MKIAYFLVLTSAVLFMVLASAPSNAAVTLRGIITDADSGAPLAARVYVQSSDGHWYTVNCAAPDGHAIEYRKQRSAQSVEIHTTLSADPFVAQLPPGNYTITVARGKEYLPATLPVTLKDQPVTVRIPLRRWIDMSAQGWYSGETHVHRSIQELPTLMRAEDLNIAFPLTYWVTRAYATPSQGKLKSPDVRPELIVVDPTHVIYPLNTEYEIGSVDGKHFTLGAFFALNHRRVLDLGVPPVAPVATQVHQQGGLIELDKHNWPWSMMLVPVMKVDLYELANNHMWRTEFFFDHFGEGPADYMHIERDQDGWTERGWIDFTLQNYYALLDCGFHLRPTAGTASGVHPVPFGFGRVYVHLDDGFSYAKWLAGLNAGHSFVTTGPLLLARMNGKTPGHTFQQEAGNTANTVAGEIHSAGNLARIEIVVNGQVVKTIEPDNQPNPKGGHVSRFSYSHSAARSFWLAVRCFQTTAEGGTRFAHTAPWYVTVPGKPIRPRPEEIQYLIQRTKAQIKRSTGVLKDAAVEEYRAALQRYQAIAQ